MRPSNLVATRLQEWIGILMRHSMRELVLYSRETGLAMSHIGAMFHVYGKGVCGVSEIGEDLGTSSAAASQMLDRLVEQGLVQRSEDPHDRRARRISLTEKGHWALREFIHARLDWLDTLSEMFSRDEQEQIAAALEVLIARAGQMEKDEQAARAA
jgi:DNA-binding MarR family transcriptional regulator